MKEAPQPSQEPQKPQQPMRESGTPQPDALQRALSSFDQAAQADKYNKDALMRAMNGVRRAHNQLGKSPGEMYAILAGLNDRAAEKAAENNRVQDATQFAKTSEVLKSSLQKPEEQPSENPTPKKGRASKRKGLRGTLAAYGSKGSR